jgi:predicted transcriptional regulator
VVDRVREETVQYFTESDDEFTNLLIQIGTKKNVARVLVFVANTEETTAKDIERGTDLRQPEVSLAMKSLVQLGWVKSRENPSAHRGRPEKIYQLAQSLTEIMEWIEKKKKDEIRKRMVHFKKLERLIE